MHESLALKYRPLTFEQLVGQSVNVRIFTSLIKRGRIGKNLVLHGPYGSSKTTSCRVYARALNCINPTAEGSPCNCCDNCTSFLNGTYSDYLECDGTTRGNKNEIKELLSIAKTPPMFGKWRVIAVDESQGVSTAGWDALLKIVEEPPPFLVFIFMTTEVDKVRPAIKSRCQCLEVSLLDVPTAKNYLISICETEGLSYDAQALNLIIFLSKGHPRDLIKNLEQVSVLGDITIDNAKDVFNVGYIKNLISVFSAIFDSNSMSDLISTIDEWNSTPKEIYETLTDFILFIQSNMILNVRLKVNPVFDLIPGNDKKSLLLRLSGVADSKGVSVGDACVALLEFFSASRVGSTISLNLFMIRLYHFVHHFGFSMGNIMSDAPMVKSIKSGDSVDGGVSHLKRKRRMFIDGYGNSDKSPPPALPDESTTIYPHTLGTCGFSSMPKNSITMVDI